jgi:Zn-dependent protease with chaperone function
LKTRGWLRFAPALLVLAALTCAAQDFDDDDDAAGFQTAATLWLRFDSQGVVDVSLDLPAIPKDWEPLRTTLAQALHCNANALNNPTPRGMSTLPETMTATQRERYQKQISKWNQRRLTGKCNVAASGQDSVLQADMAFAPFAAQLLQSGAEELQVDVQLPQTPYIEYSRSNLAHESSRTLSFLTYRIPLSVNTQPAPIHLEYGFRKKDLYRALGILAGFIFLPLFLTLWMRRSAMLAGNTDPIAAGFGFFRSLNFLVTGAMLLWITSGLQARQALQDWIAMLQLPAWQSTAASVLILVGPGFLVYWLCTLVSYPIYGKLRGSTVTWREFLSQQSVTVGTQAVPLLLFLAALQIITQHRKAAIALMVCAFVSLQFFQHLKLRIMKLFPQALTTGELRDRIFALAAKMRVEVRQVFVLPAGKGQVANAYAAKNKIVMFTDYLLEHLNKKEVDGIAAHELAHLQHKHPTKRMIAFYGALFLPSYYPLFSSILFGLIVFPLRMAALGFGSATLVSKVMSAMTTFQLWSLHDFVLIMLGLTGFYFLSRHFENVADATAVRLTGDPEAQITGLLKVSRLNRTPIHWGKAAETWLTHPSTVRRAERMAAVGGLPSTRLQEILAQYAAQNSPGSHSASLDAPQGHYIVPPASDPERIRSATSDQVQTQVKAWAILSMYVFPPALFSLAMRNLHLSSQYALGAYLGMFVASAIFVVFCGAWISESGYVAKKRRLLQLFARENLPVGRPGDVLVGFAPAAFPRIYGTRYHWDSGFLILAQNSLQFVGEHTRFSLSAQEIDGITIGRGGPSWWKYERIYIRWKNLATPDSANPLTNVFNLYLLEPCSMWQRRSNVSELCRKIQSWHAKPGVRPAVRPELSQLQSPTIGEVTCISPAKVGKTSMSLKAFAPLLLLASAVGILLGVSIPYLCGSALTLRLFQLIPYWRYKDTPPVFPPSQAAKPASRAATSGSN